MGTRNKKEEEVERIEVVTGCVLLIDQLKDIIGVVQDNVEEGTNMHHLMVSLPLPMVGGMLNVLDGIVQMVMKTSIVDMNKVGENVRHYQSISQQCDPAVLAMTPIQELQKVFSKIAEALADHIPEEPVTQQPGEQDFAFTHPAPRHLH